MILYPLIELKNGRCVGLERGQMDSATVYEDDPLDAARRFAATGAQWIQINDLDAVANTGSNKELITEMLRAAHCAVQVAGGIRTMAQVEEWLELGAARVVIASAAVKDPDFVRNAARRFPEQVVVSIDQRNGHVLASSWTEETTFSPVEFATYFENCALAAIIFTDLDRDEEAALSSFALTTEMANAITTPLISSGLVKSLDDLSRLRFLPNIHGALTGRALFQKVFTIEEALAVAHQIEGPTPDFTAA